MPRKRSKTTPEVKPRVDKLRLAGSSWQSSTGLGRARMVQKMGLQYDNDRDVARVAGYIPEGQEKFDHYLSLYERQDVAGRIVDIFPQSCWREPPTIVETGRSAKTKFTSAFDEMAKRLQLWRLFERADRLTRIGSYGVLLIGQRGGSSLKEPLQKVGGPEEIVYLSPYSEGAAKIVEWEKDPFNERFGKPTMYEIDLSSGVADFKSTKERVHHSRLLHVAEDLLEDEVFGRPALKRVLNRFFDLEKISAATAEAFWQLADKILLLSIDPNVSITPEQQEELGEAAEEMMHDLRRQLVGSGITGQWLGGDTPNPSEAAKHYMLLIASAAGIPMRILFGSETGQKASDQDERQWLGTVAERIHRHVEPVILRAFIDRMVEIGALPTPKKGYEITWPPLSKLTALEEADLNLKKAQTAQALTPAGGDPLEVVEIDEAGNLQLIPSDQIVRESIEDPEEDENAEDAEESDEDGEEDEA